MALRLIEMILKEKDAEDVRKLLQDHKVLQHRQIELPEGEVLVRILLDVEQNEMVTDLLEKLYVGREDNRAVILPVVATLPRHDTKPEPESKHSLERISREELYETIKNTAQCSHTYLAMIVLSTIVAAVGLDNNSVVIIIGAMVIVPMLGSSMALGLGATLGDLPLVWHALRTALAGILTIILLSIMIGALIHLDPTATEVVSRTQVTLSNIVVGLAAGCAGTLAFTTGVSETMIGVMVAVALLPPLVAFGMLLGAGHLELAMGALSLFLVNFVCVNLAAVSTFLVQGIYPLSWWEKDRAMKATRIAIGIWLAMLLALLTLTYCCERETEPEYLYEET